MSISKLPSSVHPDQDSERRGHMRLSVADVRWLRSARVKYGPDVRVLDISAGGIFVETEGQLRPDAHIVFELCGPINSILVPSKVLRCRVASVAEVMRYRGACAFERPLDIPDLVTQAMGTATLPPAAAPNADASTSWQQVVARFRDGHVVRGYTSHFHPSNPHLHLAAEPHSNDILFLQLSQLDALFFVRDVAGDPMRDERQECISTVHDRTVVTFDNGDTLVDPTRNYCGGNTGFFVHRADPHSNNLRIFAAPVTTQQVRFL